MSILGLDIGGTKCAVILGRDGPDGSTENVIADKIKFPTLVARGYRAVIDEIFASADAILERNSLTAKDLRAIGVSCGGPLNSRKGLIQCPPNLPDWDDVPIVAMLEERYGCPVRLQNDANACAVAEWKYGAARGCENAVFLTFGTGMGAGLILDGKLYSGTNDMAGEVGHIRLAEDGPLGYGKRGSFEGFCSGGGIALAARAKAEKYLAEGRPSGLFSRRDEIEKLTAADVAKAFYEGDEFAREVYAECGAMLGRGLSILMDILNPEVIVIGSIYARNPELFNVFITPVIEAEALSGARGVCRIVPAKLGDSIGDYAALSIAADL